MKNIVFWYKKIQHTLYIRIRIVRKVHEPVFAMRDQDVSDVIKTKNRTAMQYIGIDVSKATFVVAYSSDKGGENYPDSDVKSMGSEHAFRSRRPMRDRTYSILWCLNYSNFYRNFPAYRFYSTTKRRNIQQIITFSSLNLFVSKNVKSMGSEHAFRSRRPMRDRTYSILWCLNYSNLE